MYLLILTLPLLSTIGSGLFGRFLGGRGAAIFSTTCLILTFMLSCFAFYEVALLKTPCLIELNP